MIKHSISSLIIGIVALTRHTSQANYIKCFDNIRDSFRHPLKSMESKCAAANVFGPILSQCLNPGKYSFTCSMSLGVELGDSVYPVIGGTVVFIGKYFPRTEDLVTVIVEHKLEGDCAYEGQPVSSFFSIYSHIVTGSGSGLKVGDVVSSDDVLGTIGQCEKCEKDLGIAANLIYQVRLNVDYCADFDGDCGQFGAPVHPLVTRPAMDGEKTVTVEQMDTDGMEMDLSVAISTPCAQTDIVQYYVECGTQPMEGNMVVQETHTLNVNSREGFDPIPNLYKQNMMFPFIEPELYPFAPCSEGKWKTNLKVPSSWFELTNATQCCYIEVQDLLGVMTSDEYCGPEMDGWRI